MDFLETLDRIRAEEASIQNLFTIDMNGHVRTGRQRRQSPGYSRALVEATRVLDDVVKGRRSSVYLQAAMTTSDFPLLFGDIIDRAVLAHYAEWPVTWPAIAKRVLLNDFRDQKVYPPAWGGDSRLPTVPQDTEYPEVKLNEQAAQLFHVLKYGQRIGFSFEAMVNDDLDQLKDIPARFARAARRTEQRGVTEAYVGTSGPNAALYNGTNKNQIVTANGATVNNPPLSMSGIQDGLLVLSNQKDEAGEPIMLEMVYLVVPPALEVVARNMLNATQLWTTRAAMGGTPPNPATAGQDQLIVDNWMRNRLTLIVDPYIPMTATTNGNTSWFLFANPNAGREAIRVGFLRGHEQPEIWMKSPNATRVGGGSVDAMDGDFDTDAIVYRIRHILGVTTVDGKATVASNGTSS